MYSRDMRDFMVKVFEKSGINPRGTYLPAAIHPAHVQEPKYDMDTAMIEARAVMTGAVGELLQKTGGAGWPSRAIVQPQHGCSMQPTGGAWQQ